jgi:hypothetical protein
MEIVQQSLWSQAQADYPHLEVTAAQAELIVRTWGYKSALSPCQSHIQLVAWDLSILHPLRLWDLVPMTVSEATRHLGGRARYNEIVHHHVHVMKNLVCDSLQRASLMSSPWPVSWSDAGHLLTACGYKSLVGESNELLTVIALTEKPALHECIVMTPHEAQQYLTTQSIYPPQVLQRMLAFQTRVQELLENEASIAAMSAEKDDSEPFSDDVDLTENEDTMSESEMDTASDDSFVVADDASIIYESGSDTEDSDSACDTDSDGDELSEEAPLYNDG